MWLWICCFVIGALVSSRFWILYIQDGIDQRQQPRWDEEERVAVIFMSLVWPFVAAFWILRAAFKAMKWLYMAVMFPRGIVSETAKKDRIQARAAEIQALAEAHGLPGHVGQVLPHGIAAAYFAEAAAHVEQTKGSDWKASASSTGTPALTGAPMAPRKSGRKVSGYNQDYDCDDLLQTIAAGAEVSGARALHLQVIRDTDWAAIHADQQKLRQDAENCTSFTDRQVGYGGGLR